jgi:branched-chain amino acid transport system permease protein
MMGRRAEIMLVIVAVGLLALVPVLGGNFYTVQFTRILVYAIFAMSLDLLVGYAGLVSMGHAAFFGVAAYTCAMMATKADVYSLWVLLPASLVVAGLAALVIGALSLRTTKIYFIMVTLAFSQIVFFIVHDVRAFGGSDGLLLEKGLQLEVAGLRLIDLGSRANRFYATFWSMCSYGCSWIRCSGE